MTEQVEREESTMTPEQAIEIIITPHGSTPTGEANIVIKPSGERYNTASLEYEW
jgi:hypothetical protein